MVLESYPPKLVHNPWLARRTNSAVPLRSNVAPRLGVGGYGRWMTGPSHGKGVPVSSPTMLARVATDRPAVVLLVDVGGRRIVHANASAQRLAPGLALPSSIQEWSATAGLQDLQGRDLSGAAHSLLVAARGEEVSDRVLTAQRAFEASGAAREPFLVVGLTLTGSAALDGHVLVALLPLRETDEAWQRDVQQLVRDGAALAASCSFTLASSTEPDLPLRWVDPAFSVLTGYPIGEAVGRNCRFLQGPGTDQARVTELREALLAGRDATVVLLNYRKDGTAFWNQLAVSPIVDATGHVTHVVGIQTDVTDRVETDRRYEVALQAERSARADAVLAQEQAELLSRRMMLMAEVSSLLAGTLDVAQSLDRLARLIVPLLADWVVINLTDERGELGPRSFVRHRDGREDLLDRYRELVPAGVGAGSPLHALLAGGPAMLMAQFLAPPAAELTVAEQQIREISLELGASSLAFVPLTARRRVVGTMMLVHGTSGRQFDDDDLALAADLGRRAGLAVDNAQLYTREHATAVTLQRSLLPSLPDLPGLALAALYLPAGHDSQVGGDWWDAFALPDGATGLAIGDVMGHDLAAAAAMGQLRSVLRTCAWAGDDPAAVLDRMDQLVQSFEMAQLATCFYARLEPASRPGAPRRLIWSNAGHLPPILLDPTRPASLLAESGDVPIGAAAAQSRRNGEVLIVPGATLLLYTDGLIETRDGDLDSDLQRLLRDVAAHPPAAGPKELINRLVADVTELTDDVALLAIQVL